MRTLLEDLLCLFEPLQESAIALGGGSGKAVAVSGEHFRKIEDSCLHEPQCMGAGGASGDASGGGYLGRGNPSVGLAHEVKDAEQVKADLVGFGHCLIMPELASARRGRVRRGMEISN